MKFKVLDISLIADKALDIYASDVMRNTSSTSTKNNSSSIKSSVMKIFDEVFNEVVDSYSKIYDATFIIVPCYPMMRMHGASSILSRFICKNPSFLRENGISSNHFIEYFEKFIQLKCKSERTELNDGKIIILKEKTVLFNEWKRMIIHKYGSSLVDTSISEPFTNNPGFIMTMEDDMSVFTSLDEFTGFKIEKLL